MSALQAIRCKGCGGAVSARPGQAMPRCLFCGATDLVTETVDEAIEEPDHWLPFTVEHAGAALGQPGNRGRA